MKTAVKVFSVLDGLIWGFLLAQNVWRYLSGWGHSLWVDLYGLVPMAGLILAIVTYRGKQTQRGIWTICILTIIAVLYLVIAESPAAVDAQMVHIPIK